MSTTSRKVALACARLVFPLIVIAVVSALAHAGQWNYVWLVLALVATGYLVDIREALISIARHDGRP